MNTGIPHSKPCLTQKDYEAVQNVLHFGMIAEGELVRQFEQQVACYLDLAGGVATSSGTSALFLALKALEVGNGDEVILPTYVCHSVWDAVFATGATPILCDIGANWCMNVNTVKPHMTPRTKAIVVVHIFGAMADLQPICQLGIPVIEDCCQAFGAKAGAGLAGTLGQFCFLSFHATKLLATGEGGMVLSNDSQLLSRMEDIKFAHNNTVRGCCDFPMSDIQAALGLSQLQQYDYFLERRQNLAKQYFDGLKRCSVRLPHVISRSNVFFRYPIRQNASFETTQKKFAELGIQVRGGVDALLHWDLNEQSNSYPVAERMFKETLSIPIYPALTDNEVSRIMDACCKIWGYE